MPATTVARMSRRELVEIVSNAVEQKLVELFGDPDDGLAMKAAMRKRLLRQKRAVAKGERGTNLNAVRKQLGL